MFLNPGHGGLRAGMGTAGSAARDEAWAALEGRAAFRREEIARALGSMSLSAPEAFALDATVDRTALVSSLQEKCISIYVSSLGNIFMKEIAEDLAADLRSAGVKVALLDERAESRAEMSLGIVVAPHEFFILGQGPRWMEGSFVANSFMLNTEQLQTPWFARALPALLMSRGILDLSPQVSCLLAQAGLPALHFEPSSKVQAYALDEADVDHPLFKSLPAQARNRDSRAPDWSARPISVSFFGSESARRDAFFARNAGFFARIPSFIYYRRASRGPIRAEAENQSLTRLAGHVAGQSKISLNIHRDEFPYFEWHRMVRQGMASGALVVTDPCLPHPEFKPGQHFFQEDARHLPALLDWLMFDVDGQVESMRVRENAAALLSHELRKTAKIDTLLAFLAQHESIQQ
ncbi:hypothetical protein M2165_000859 [Variovorax sp. TBS-050B]|uniref:hypothetical protein n=1 Tax=Variovorax sp. TBS-050B TaxID=2940551 RepID=UPI0024767F7B|nr:hypothetical protein [Variovorax sp. TBS-050B]MDH6590970.1 hypothetical protein [Variovorax sp. TBS-050B]